MNKLKKFLLKASKFLLGVLMVAVFLADVTVMLFLFHYVMFLSTAFMYLVPLVACPALLLLPGFIIDELQNIYMDVELEEERLFPVKRMDANRRLMTRRRHS
jgi:hypothetical protein